MLRCARNDGARCRAIVSNSHLNRGHAFASSRHVSPEFCLVTPPSKPRGRREGRVLTSHPRSAARKAHAGKPHSSIQVVPITRPSLRDGWTAYAVLSREPSSFWPPSPRELTMLSARLGSHTPPRKLDRSNDGQDHTVLPYAAHPASPRGFAGLRRRSSARRSRAHRDYPPCPRLSRTTLPRVHRNPARVSNDSRTAPLRGPGCCDVCSNSEFR